MSDEFDDFVMRCSDRSKRKFSEYEDSVIRDMVKEHGTHSWKLISESLFNRTPRQCRERWKHYLSQEINKEPWTEEEDRLLEEEYKKVGAKWSTIAKLLPGRTDVNIKNRWSLLLRKHKKLQKIKAEKPEPSNSIIDIQDIDYDQFFMSQENKTFELIMKELEFLQNQTSDKCSEEMLLFF